MSEDSSAQSAGKAPVRLNATTVRWLASATILAVGLVIAGFALGDGIKRAQRADRAVTVKGLAEREVTADLATWTISYSATAPDLATAQSGVDRDTAQIRAFFGELGFPADALQPTGVNVNQAKDNNGVVSFTVRQRVTLRTNDIKRAENAVRRQFDLVRRGVILEEGSGMAYAFTRLNDIKPQMVAAATNDARAAAEQFAKDSGSEVGAIKNAAQGYFSVEARDGDSGGGWGQSDTPYKKVRVVTTIDFYLK
ncbi:SIMPL domain-containing protein [Novosphingobium sp. BL-52-GroH]|uniref:SIMPL domain-containing protein n=1 Tax=Novosphingobium sp. BL-52-GroH TaxID=3349877 RepID=UPI00384DEF5A